MTKVQKLQEVFKPINDYEGLYEISNLGRVKSCSRTVTHRLSTKYINERFKKTGLDKYGYVCLSLSKNGHKKHFTIHRLVAIHFIPNPENKPTVNHKFGIKTNNTVNDLEWATLSEQNKHSLKLNLRRHPSKIKPGMLGKFGKEHNQSKPVIQLDLNDNIIKRWDCAKDAKRIGGFTPTHISRCCKGLAKSHKGFKWQFE